MRYRLSLEDTEMDGNCGLQEKAGRKWPYFPQMLFFKF